MKLIYYYIVFYKFLIVHRAMSHPTSIPIMLVEKCLKHPFVGEGWLELWVDSIQEVFEEDVVWQLEGEVYWEWHQIRMALHRHCEQRVDIDGYWFVTCNLNVIHEDGCNKVKEIILRRFQLACLRILRVHLVYLEVPPRIKLHLLVDPGNGVAFHVIDVLDTNITVK